MGYVVRDDGWLTAGNVVYFLTSSFVRGAGALSLSRLIFPLVALMPVVSIDPSFLAPFVMPGFSMSDCGAGPLFCAKVKMLIKEKAMTAKNVFIGLSFGS
jgi:hypothetical protein